MEVQSVSIRCSGLSELGKAAKQLIGLGANTAVWLFKGDMGVGKTTLIKELCSQLGVGSPVQSPTFSIVNEYDAGENGLIYHFDFYRVKNEAEAYDIGTEEYLHSGERCFIEWPDKIESLWPDNRLHVTMTREESGERIIQASIVNI